MNQWTKTTAINSIVCVCDRNVKADDESYLHIDVYQWALKELMFVQREWLFRNHTNASNSLS